MNKIKKYVFFLLVATTSINLQAGDTIPLKRNSLQLKLSNAILVNRFKTYHYYAPAPYIHAVSRDGMLTEYTTYFNPKVNVGYEHSFIKKRQQKTPNDHWWSVSGDVGFKVLTSYNKFQGIVSGVGLYSDYMSLRKDQFWFFNLSTGIKYNWKNYNKTIFGISLAASRSHWYRQYATETFLNKDGTVNWKYQAQNDNPNLLNYTEAFSSIEAQFSIGKKIGKRNIGLYIEYSLSDFTIKNKFYWFYSSSFLIDYHCIYLGTYFNL